MLSQLTYIRRGVRSRAFTLVELLVVVLIIVVLMGLLIPALSSARNSAKKASTVQLMQSVLAACSAYKIDHPSQETPGPFTVEQIGSTQNNPVFGPGISSMQNALLDLSGGVVAKGASAPAADASTHQTLISFKNTGGAPSNVLVDPGLVGAPGGPGYLSIPAANRALVEGKRNFGRPFIAATPTNNTSMNYFPDVVDAWGYPILMWVQNPAAGPNPAFASMNSPFNTTDLTAVRARFYWMSNAEYLIAHSLGPNALAEDMLACLGKKSTGNAGITGPPPNSDADRIASMEALLGNPGEPMITKVKGPLDSSMVSPVYSPAKAGAVNNSPLARRQTLGVAGGFEVHPGSAKGDIILHSAGVDGYYLSRNGNAFIRATYLPYDDRNGNGQNDGGNEVLPGNYKWIEQFDDFTVAGGS